MTLHSKRASRRPSSKSPRSETFFERYTRAAVNSWRIFGTSVAMPTPSTVLDFPANLNILILNHLSSDAPSNRIKYQEKPCLIFWPPSPVPQRVKRTSRHANLNI